MRTILKTQTTHMTNDWYFRTTTVTRVTSVEVLVQAAVQQAVAGSAVIDRGKGNFFFKILSTDN